jgi:hypothetical protein
VTRKRATLSRSQRSPDLPNRQRAKDKTARSDLPDERDQSIGDGATVVVVSRKLGRERAFLVEDSCNRNGDSRLRRPATPTRNPAQSVLRRSAAGRPHTSDGARRAGGDKNEDERDDQFRRLNGRSRCECAHRVCALLPRGQLTAREVLAVSQISSFKVEVGSCIAVRLQLQIGRESAVAAWSRFCLTAGIPPRGLSNHWRNQAISVCNSFSSRISPFL